MVFYCLNYICFLFAKKAEVLNCHILNYWCQELRLACRCSGCWCFEGTCYCLLVYQCCWRTWCSAYLSSRTAQHSFGTLISSEALWNSGYFPFTRMIMNNLFVSLLTLFFLVPLLVGSMRFESHSTFLSRACPSRMLAHSELVARFVEAVEIVDWWASASVLQLQ